MNTDAAHNADGDTFSSLEATGETYTKGSPQDRAIRTMIVRTFAPYLNPSMRALQLGYAEGVDTGLLAPLLQHLDVVEGNHAFYETGCAAGIANAAMHHDLFESFLPKIETRYDALFAVYVLEHVEDPVSLLRLAKSSLTANGLLFIVVPNARALSRQLALKMGLLPSLTCLTPHDHAHGHRRVYDQETLLQDISAAGLNVVARGGVMLKILADFQLDALMRQGILGAAQLNGLYLLGHDYPALCGSLYAVCAAGLWKEHHHDNDA